ncbi:MULTISPECIES: YunG family protein [Cytobacillus]|uniref:YunG family protein n=1 Tax=Cytobacillus TaxID=2675230 RepID=UPI001CD4221A|nr:hypothetical protein [Cytobacillus kochii]MCA1024825.1 hypothetical protein [Cytobacillus kochii]MDM5206516.1 hypothetical protein [Cytobacillus kochii]
MDISYLGLALVESWGIETSTKWKMENPASGQCGVTALVVQEYLGGEIVKTFIGEMWHFYNKIGDNYIDFTASQFDTAIDYKPVVSNRQEAFEDTNIIQYRYLTKEMNNRLYYSLER